METSDQTARPTPEELAAIARGDGPAAMPLARLYFRVDGRISRRTFWLHGVLALLLLDVMGDALFEIAGFEPEIAGSLSAAIMAWPLIAISGKRLHDFNCSAWWMLVNLVPGVGSLATLAMLGLLPGTHGPNRFGPDPLLARGRAFLLNSVH